MKNIQIIDRAANATFSVFQCSDEAFAQIFPMPGQDLELVEDFIARVGGEIAGQVLAPLWERPVLKRDLQGLHGTLFYGWNDRREYLPVSRREIDVDPGAINAAQRALFKAARAAETAKPA